jgi:hypothetical protein
MRIGLHVDALLGRDSAMPIELRRIAIEHELPLARRNAHGPIDERLMTMEVAGEKVVAPKPDKDFIGIVLG